MSDTVKCLRILATKYNLQQLEDAASEIEHLNTKAFLYKKSYDMVEEIAYTAIQTLHAVKNYPNIEKIIGSEIYSMIDKVVKFKKD